MSFHGGVIGIVISIFLFSTKNNIKFLSLTDLIATAAPIGIFLGRISNFLNGELWGRASEMPWAVKFLNVEEIYIDIQVNYMKQF